MRSLALVVCSFGFGLAIQCPSGFTDPSNNTGNCYQFGANGQSVIKPRSSAQAWCSEKNATLPIIRNLQENNVVYANLPGGYSWIGLTCTTSDSSSCVWDDGTPLRDGDYQNFASGHPNSSIGSCIGMDTYRNRATTGQWLSFSCGTELYTIAEYEYGLQYSLCPDGSRYFNGSCYFGMVANSVSDGITRCQEANGNLASIHSDSENNIVLSVARLLEPTEATFLGLTLLSNNSYSWSDGTAVDYKNFGLENKQYGNCVEMALIDRIIPHGTWVNSQCASSTPVNMICKIPADKMLATSMIMSPAKCSSPIFLNGNGMVASPGYASSSDANSCQYLVSVDPGQLASITFSQISLDSNSKIALFSNIFDKNPFATITATINDTAVYKSTGNTLTMLYTTSGASGNHFFGYFGTNLSPITSQDVYYNSGNVGSTPDNEIFDFQFTSPNYPGNYPYNLNFEYRLLSSKNRVALNFQKFNTYQGYDYLFIYDGNGTQLGVLSGSAVNYSISSITNSMRLVFMTHYSAGGFTAEFISIL